MSRQIVNIRFAMSAPSAGRMGPQRLQVLDWLGVGGLARVLPWQDQSVCQAVHAARSLMELAAMNATALAMGFDPATPPTHAVPPQAEGVASLAAVRELVRRELAPKVVDIDLKAEYPQAFMRELGRLGGYAGAASEAFGGNGLGLGHVIRVMEQVSKECVSTGFLVWCQTACARYVNLSANEALKQTWLPRIVSGEQLAGTGLSNTMKSSDKIEEYRLSARRVEGGYAVNGVLPWVSNLGPDHVFTTGCPVRSESGEAQGLMFMLVDCAQPGFKLVDCAHFIGMDGTRTLACHFKECFIPDARVLAHPAEADDYLQRIKPGMVLGQMGMGLGLIDACATLMGQANKTTAHVNQFIDDQVADVDQALQAAREATYALAEALDARGGPCRMLDILKVRLAGSEWALRSAQAAMLHQGARGYLVRNATQRRLREAYFVAIVTPALKHLRKEIARIEGQRLPAACLA